MALPPVHLDSVTWTELVDAARDQVAAVSRGAWTHHAPVDPGITLVELYAWLFDQQVYWLDQVSEPMKRAVLALLGVQPIPTGIARTVVGVERRANATLTTPVPIPAGASLTRGLGPERIGFTTTTPLTWYPVVALNLVAGGADRTADLGRGRAIRLFPATSDGADLRSCTPCLPPRVGSAVRHFEVRVHTAAAPQPDQGPLSLLFDLDGPPEQLPGWELNGVQVGSPVTLIWEIGTATGWREITVQDGTSGLRRTGLVQIPGATDWAAGADGAYALRVDWVSGDFASPPRLRGLRANVAVAEHRTPAQWELAVDWLPLPRQVTSLDPAPVEPPIAETLVAHLRQGTSWSEPWRHTDELLFHTAAERVFRADRPTGVLVFGDGIHGRIPRPAPQPTEANLRVSGDVGGGARGNLPRGLPFELSWPSAPPELDHLVARSAVHARNGADAETLDEALQRAAAELSRRERAVNRGDFVELALLTPGVEFARAHVAAGYLAGHGCSPVPGALTVFVVPSAPRSGTPWDDAPTAWADPASVATPRADSAALQALAAHLDRRRLVGTEVAVGTPRYLPVRLRIELTGEIADPSAIRTTLSTRLGTHLDPLVGGPTGTGWPFGGVLRPSELLHVAQRALPDTTRIERVVIQVGDDEAEDCADVPIGAHDLVFLAALEISARPTPTAGGLR